ncbi:hypothetical protein [uncultured Spirosoma sp.]|uniref:hypothetical protein n=1 Tax=uncultured Spirosoma sp. TaxID=278208 RepID=UPI002586577A|nr:hypothetical protein [uncultured Spirosoma sp.]
MTALQKLQRHIEGILSNLEFHQTRDSHIPDNQQSERVWEAGFQHCLSTQKIHWESILKEVKVILENESKNPNSALQAESAA